jgi:ABC-type nitrate/sulfonate/bicarbonate transport system permease component
MSARRRIGQQLIPVAFGIACLLALLVLAEALIAAGIVNPFIVPPPSEIVLSFKRVLVEEQVLPRFLLTCGEALMASFMLTVVGIALGVLLHRRRSSGSPPKPGLPPWRRRRWC